MTRRRDLERHRDSLEEIGEILSSMRTLAYLETRKLSRFLAAQRKVLESISEVATDFMSFYPGLPVALQEATPVYLVVGSERGFCGDFNRAISRRLAKAAHAEADVGTQVVAVGHKLHSVLGDDESVVAFLDGASVVEEIPSILERLTNQLNSLRAAEAGMSLYGIYHDESGVALTPLLPPFAGDTNTEPSYAFPPLLNVSAEEFLRDLIDHYLFAALNTMLYTSLMTENQRRVSHLEGAVRHLDEQSDQLTRKCKALRQEEIVEEIEVILLSAAELDADTETIRGD